MDPITAYELAKLRMAERELEAARERMVRQARSYAGSDEDETSIRRRWTLRRVVGRITLAHLGA